MFDSVSYGFVRHHRQCIVVEGLWGYHFLSNAISYFIHSYGRIFIIDNEVSGSITMWSEDSLVYRETGTKTGSLG